MAKVKKLSAEQENVTIALSEGIKFADGSFVCELGNANAYVDVFGHKMLSGAGVTLANKIASELGLKTRSIEFSTLQRAASHVASLADVNEAFRLDLVA